MTNEQRLTLERNIIIHLIQTAKAAGWDVLQVGNGVDTPIPVNTETEVMEAIFTAAGKSALHFTNGKGADGCILIEPGRAFDVITENSHTGGDSDDFDEMIGGVWGYINQLEDSVPKFQISLDGGKTWIDAPLGVRVIVREVSATDNHELEDLHLNFTPNVVYLDLLGQKSCAGPAASIGYAGWPAFADKVSDMTVINPAFKITDQMLSAAVKIDNLDAAVKSVMDQVGITEGGVAGMAFSKYEYDWHKADSPNRLRMMQEWRVAEQAYDIPYSPDYEDLGKPLASAMSFEMTEPAAVRKHKP